MAKTKTIAVIQYKYGNLPWEDVCEYHPEEYESRLSMEKAVRHDLKEYIASNTGSYRRINRRIKEQE